MAKTRLCALLLGAALALGLAGVQSAKAAPLCRDIAADGGSYVVCEVPASADLRLFHSDDSGKTYGTFERLNRALKAQGQELVLAMNAGMYHDDRRPVGLYTEAGQQLAPLITSAGPGNFGMLPNGVFCITATGFSVVESRAFKAKPPACLYATQSGPMLVIEGALHPRFLPDGESRHIRNGVGVRPDGMVVLAISLDPVSLGRFARLFRDTLGCPNALFLDGAISALSNGSRTLLGGKQPVGPIVAVMGASEEAP